MLIGKRNIVIHNIQLYFFIGENDLSSPFCFLDTLFHFATNIKTSLDVTQSRDKGEK